MSLLKIKIRILKFYEVSSIFLIDILYFIPTIILKVLKIEFLNIYTQAVGHLLLDSDTHIKKKKLNLIPNNKSILLVDKKDIANLYFVKYLEIHFIVFQNHYLVKILKPFLDFKRIGVNVVNYTSAIDKTAEIFKINSIWSNKGLNPIFRPIKSDILRGDQALQKLGVLENNWFVCLHVRSSGFSTMENIHNYRNTDFDTYIPAIKYIISMGGLCVRMGDSSMPAAPQISGLIDYAHSEIKADWLDLYISSKCKFFIGTGSGASAMAFIFGVPTVSLNICPFSSVPLIASGDISIPKLYLNKINNNLMGFKEIMSSDCANFRYNDLFVNEQIEVINNTSEEIKDTVMEMYLRLSNKWITLPDDEELHDLYLFNLKENHYAFNSSARVGMAFLKKYKNLLN
jgi:putative glycosyltransferase (TIGR04372 family)